jgi:hypothetical protein
MRKATLKTTFSRLVALVGVLAAVSTAALVASPASDAAVTFRGCGPDSTLGSSTPYQRICTSEGDMWSGGVHYYFRMQIRQNYNYSYGWVSWQVIEQGWRYYGNNLVKILCRITDNGGVSYC